MIGIDIFKDDILIILNIEGSQICEMSFLIIWENVDLF